MKSPNESKARHHLKEAECYLYLWKKYEHNFPEDRLAQALAHVTAALDLLNKAVNED